MKKIKKVREVEPKVKKIRELDVSEVSERKSSSGGLVEHGVVSRTNIGSLAANASVSATATSSAAPVRREESSNRGPLYEKQETGDERKYYSQTRDVRLERRLLPGEALQANGIQTRAPVVEQSLFAEDSSKSKYNYNERAGDSRKKRGKLPWEV